jgi:hypothetical protein
MPAQVSGSTKAVGSQLNVRSSMTLPISSTAQHPAGFLGRDADDLHASSPGFLVPHRQMVRQMGSWPVAPVRTIKREADHGIFSSADRVCDRIGHGRPRSPR